MTEKKKATKKTQPAETENVDNEISTVANAGHKHETKKERAQRLRARYR